jgi:transcriptional regulator NrdR family protein
MICPYCHNIASPKEVLRTWTVKNGSVKRKRKCPRCKNHFHTVEMVVVIKDRILYGLHDGKHLV